MDYTYYPGCSLESAHSSYNDSVKKVFSHLECNLVELEDWNCCGATSYMSVKETVGFAISARNLALAEKHKRDIRLKAVTQFLTGFQLPLLLTFRVFAPSRETQMR